MIRHMVLFRFRSDVDADGVQAVLDELAALPSYYAEMRNFGVGENVSKRDRTYSHAMTVEFDERSQLEAYLNSSRHERFVAERFLPAVEHRVIASYEAS